MVYGTNNYSFHGLYKPTFITTGGPTAAMDPTSRTSQKSPVSARVWQPAWQVSETLNKVAILSLILPPIEGRAFIQDEIWMFFFPLGVCENVKMFGVKGDYF